MMTVKQRLIKKHKLRNSRGEDIEREERREEREERREKREERRDKREKKSEKEWVVLIRWRK